jgi:rSAM/selenodomain-associated transferase 2
VKLSVVIPTLDEAEHIEAAIQAAMGGALDARDCGSGPSRAAPLAYAALSSAPAGIAPPSGTEEGLEAVGRASGRRHSVPPGPDPVEDIEVIVVDGGSADATVERAEALGAHVIRSERGRARQLQRGVQWSRGDALVLVHADTCLPPGWPAALRRALADERVVGGAFRLHFDERTPFLRAIEWGTRLRVALWRLPYGDQALFVRRSALDAVGGVPQVPVMEDLDLVQALKGRGRLALLSLPAVTSARRYRAGGPLRTRLRHWLAAAAWTVGVDRARVAQWVGR